MYRSENRAALLLATGLCLAMTGAGTAAAQTADRLNSIETQIRALQDELRRVKRDLAQKHAAQSPGVQSAGVPAPGQPVAPGQAILPVIPQGYALVPAAPGSAPGTVVLAQQEQPAGPKLPKGAVRLGPVTFQFGGFIEAAGIYRSRNEVADIGSSWSSGIPLPNSQLYHENEFRASARQSRLSFDATAHPDDVTNLESYFETDFLGTGPTSNSNESNSYSLRLRLAYLQYGRTDWGFDALAGQTWSLLTQNTRGDEAHRENVPLTIDAQYVPGFTWSRQPGVRVSKTFADDLFTVAMSAENAQSVYYTGPNGLAPAALGTVNVANPGGSLLPSNVNFSDSVAPDLIGKVAWDPGFGHFEAYGVLDFLESRVSTLGRGASNTVTGGGGGAGLVIPIIPDVLTFEASTLIGHGVGRYGSAQLPDATIGRNGAPKPLTNVMALGGVILHATPQLDFYGYFGGETVGRSDFAAAGKGFGYGSPIYSNASCNTELGAAAACVGNTSSVWQGTLGYWWKFLKGDFGTMQLGGQYSYTRRDVFQGIGPTPKTDENVFLVSFRYYPYQ